MVFFFCTWLCLCNNHHRIIENIVFFTTIFDMRGLAWSWDDLQGFKGAEHKELLSELYMAEVRGFTGLHSNMGSFLSELRLNRGMWSRLPEGMYMLQWAMYVGHMTVGGRVSKIWGGGSRDLEAASNRRLAFASQPSPSGSCLEIKRLCVIFLDSLTFRHAPFRCWEIVDNYFPDTWCSDERWYWLDFKWSKWSLPW